MLMVCSVGEEFGIGVVNIVKCLRVGKTSPALGIGVASMIVTLEEAAWGRPGLETCSSSFFRAELEETSAGFETPQLEDSSAGCEIPQLIGKKLFVFDRLVLFVGEFDMGRG